MSVETSEVKVGIFGQTYTIKGDTDAEYIRELAEYVNNKMEEVRANISSGNPTQVAILVALNIADEYFQLKKLKNGMENAVEEKAKNIISMLDEGLVGDILSMIEEQARPIQS